MKILLVDNNPILLKYLENILEKEGHEVLSAADGLKASDSLESFIPDFVIIDYVMPNIDGKTLCKIIRAKLAHCPVTLVSVTNYVDLFAFIVEDFNHFTSVT